MVQWLRLCAPNVGGLGSTPDQETRFYMPQQRLGAAKYINIFFKKPGFSGGPAVKNLPADAEDTGSIPGPGRSHMPRGN